MRYTHWIAVVVLLFTNAASAQENRTSLGILTCTSGDKGTLTCGFKPTESGAEERYIGTISSRSEAAPASKVVLIWAVLGPADKKASAGMLAQRFVKASGPTTRPPTLVGEKNTAIILQFETSNGTEASDAITHIDLKLTTTPA
jgi:hypothetical protein